LNASREVSRAAKLFVILGGRVSVVRAVTRRIDQGRLMAGSIGSYIKVFYQLMAALPSISPGLNLSPCRVAGQLVPGAWSVCCISLAGGSSLVKPGVDDLHWLLFHAQDLQKA